MVTFNFSR